MQENVLFIPKILPDHAYPVAVSPMQRLPPYPRERVQKIKLIEYNVDQELQLH